MAGYISEFFGYRAEDSSAVALCAANQKRWIIPRKTMK